MKKILLIEPNQLLAGQYRQYLEGLGYAVIWSKNAQDGINLADQKNPDLIILELLLAAHSGVEFLYEFRSYSEWKDVPVILLSRLKRDEMPVSDAVLTELGVAVYLYKPETSLKRLGERVAAIVPLRVRQ